MEEIMDTYTKVVLTVIAVALSILAIRPFFDTRAALAQGTADVRIVGVSVSPGDAARPVPVRCVDGCWR